MKKTIRIVSLLLALLMVLSIISCGGKDKNKLSGKPETSPETLPIEQVNLPEIVLMMDNVTLKVGETLALSGAYVLKNCQDPTVSYATGDPLVATVNVDGLVRGITPGTTTITLSAANGACTKNIALTVTSAGTDIPNPPNPPDDDDPPKPPKPSIELSFGEITLTVGESKQIAYTLLNCEENAIVSFASSSNVAKVNANGLIEAVSAGSAVITVSVTGGVSATVNVTVKDPEVPVSKVPHYEPTLDSGVTYTNFSAKNVKHVFFHNLVAFDDPTDYYDKDCLYVSEFKAILEQLYDNGYVLINIDYIYEYYEEDGVLKAKLRDTIKVPAGKKPLIISVDNVCYPSNEHGMGRVDRLVVKNGKLYTYTKLKDGTDFYSDDNEIFPILENFIAKHPDFSFSGARCVVAPSGYAGLFGYNTTSKATAAQKAEAETEVAKIVDWFRGNGYTFACHSYSHGDYSTMTVENIRKDFEKWDNEVLPYIGRTYVFIYPFGNFTQKNSNQAKELSAKGFAVFCATSMNGVNWNNFPLAGNCYNERIILDGQCLRKYADHENMKALFDAYTVYDNSQRTIKLERSITVTLDHPTLSLEIGQTAVLNATVKGSSAKVVFSSDNPCVSVDQSGKVTALSAGKAKITAACGLYTATCEVTVTEAQTITLNCYHITLHVNDSILLVATTNVPDATLVWTTSNEEAVFVDDGNVRALAPAEAVIVRVQAANGSCYAECMIDIV